VKAPGWKRGEFAVAGGAVVSLAACAETAGSIYARFSADFAGLSPLDRAGVALWDLRPLGAAVFALGALLVLRGLEEAPGHGDVLRPALAVASAAFAALGVAVVALAGWIGGNGMAGDPDGLALRFTSGERIATIATQVAGWLPLLVFLVFLALRLTKPPKPEAVPAETTSVLAEMDALWRERLAFSPRRERGRALLARIRALEAEGRLTEARELADEMRRL
jgi:hypothetical protein